MLKRIANKLKSILGGGGAAPAKKGCGYISAQETVNNAKLAGLSVTDYVEQLWSSKGQTAQVIAKMGEYGMSGFTNAVVCEIGAGTGRYMEGVLKTIKPVRYESYETAPDWAAWLAETYPVISHDADGNSLSATTDSSVDIIHAHGVFVYIPFLATYKYFLEIFRIAKPGGLVVFDIISEDCLKPETVKGILASNQDYLSFISKPYVINLFEQNGFTFKGDFTKPYGAGISQYLIFNKR